LANPAAADNFPAISSNQKHGMGEHFRQFRRLRGFAVAASLIGLLALTPSVGMAQTPSPSPPSPTTATAPAPPAAAGVTFGFAPLPANPNPAGIIDEVKTGLLAHDVGFLGDHTERGFDVNLEMLFTSPDLLAILGSPRPHIGADINTAGDTSDLFGGLTWGISLIQNLFRPGDAVFLNGSLGGALQDGYSDGTPLRKHKKLGSPVLFRESAELGYQVTPTISISAILEHISNADLAQHNAGITSAGGRVGFKF
jgi:lipid A 3-O-deacylase